MSDQHRPPGGLPPVYPRPPEGASVGPGYPAHPANLLSGPSVTPAGEPSAGETPIVVKEAAGQQPAWHIVPQADGLRFIPQAEEGEFLLQRDNLAQRLNLMPGLFMQHVEVQLNRKVSLLISRADLARLMRWIGQDLEGFLSALYRRSAPFLLAWAVGLAGLTLMAWGTLPKGSWEEIRWYADLGLAAVLLLEWMAVRMSVRPLHSLIAAAWFFALGLLNLLDVLVGGSHWWPLIFTALGVVLAASNLCVYAAFSRGLREVRQARP